MRRSRGFRVRSRARGLFALATLGVGGLVLALYAVPTSASPNGASRAGHVAATTVTVSATEFKFRLSRSKVPTGLVTFKVTNRGKIAHDFKINGHKTPLLQPGRSATLRVKFAKSGRFAYTCTVPGHAAAGMKGVVAVGKASLPPPSSTTSTTTSTTTTTTTTIPPGAVQIQVLMNEFSFKLSQTSVPVGTTVVFNVVNQGQIDHNFGMPSLNVVTPNVAPGGQAQLVVTFSAAGQIYYVCNLPQHAEAGMSGFFTVTG